MKKLKKLTRGTINRFHSGKIQFFEPDLKWLKTISALFILDAGKCSHDFTFANSEDQDEIPLKP